MRNFLSKLLFAVAGLLMSLMAMSLFIQIIARETSFGADWTEEMSRFSFIVMVFLASTFATLSKSHLRVSVFSDLLAGWIGERPVHLFHLLVLVVFDTLMVWYGMRNFTDGLQFPNISPAIGFNQNWLFVSLIIGFALSGVIHVVDAVSLRKPVAAEARQ